MAVSDHNVTDALTYLASDPHPLAVAKFRLTMAENKSRETFAQQFLTSSGSVKERESWAETSVEYSAAKQAEADCVMELERHKSRTKAADMLLEVWRTENANARAAERVR